MQGTEFLDQTATLFLVFKGTFILFSTAAASVYILIDHVGGFPFLHALSNIIY